MDDFLGQLANIIKNNQASIDVDLPIFRPDSMDAKKWLNQIEDIKAEFKWTDQQLLLRINRALAGTGSVWIATWQPDERSWAAFKRDFAEAFPPTRNLGRLLTEAATFTSSKCNTYEAYVFEKNALLRNLRANWGESDVIQIIVHGIENANVRLNASNQNFQKLSDLISYLSAFQQNTSHLRETSTDNSEPKSKRMKTNFARGNDSKRCFRCGKPGHIERKCFSRLPQTRNKPAETVTRPSTSIPKQATICEFCAKPGHEESACFTKRSIQERKQINVCSTNSSVISNELTIDGRKFYGIVDTGADVSLISDKHIQHFADKLTPCRKMISGILPGNAWIEKELTTNVTICGENAKLTLLFVPASFLDYDVIIGRDLYDNTGLVAVTDDKGTRVVHPDRSQIFSLNSEPTSINLQLVDVPEEYRAETLHILQKYPNIFASGNSIPAVKNTKMEINLTRDTVVYRNPYRLSSNEREAVRNIVQDLVNNEIIRESQSPFASPILLVRKKDGTYRMCVDYRELNKSTVKDRYPLPLIDDQLDRLGQGKLFTSLDMSSGFHQIPIHEDSIPKTAFVTPDGHFEYLRMPFGLSNAPAVFQRAVHRGLGNLKDTVALVYLDDILIPSVTFEEGLRNLDIVLAALQEEGFSLNVQKCHFFQKEIEYLGREISGAGIRPGSRKVDALLKVPPPENVKQVRQFLGLAGYFRKFIPNFAAKTACITKLTKNNEEFCWTEEQENSRKYIMDCLTSRPLLSIFNEKLPTELHTDASSIGYGAVLMQKLDGERRIIGYFSKRTTPAESRYHSYELETLAIVNALKNFRVYLLGLKFEIITDCNAVKATATKKDILPRVARWWSYMQDFDFEIVYRKGSALPHVDFLSRNPTVRKITAEESWLYIEQRSDNEVKQLIEDASTGNLDPTRYVVRNGILNYVLQTPHGQIVKPFVPRKSRLGLLRIFHDEQCHVGIDKTIASIQKHFWFPKLRNFVKNYVRHCLVCAVKKTRSGPKQGFLCNVQKPEVPMAVVHADCLGPLAETIEGYKHILVLVDAFSKYCVMQPLKTVQTEETENAFRMFISLFGTPNQITMDAGKNFKNLRIPQFLDTLGISYHYTTPDIHRSNGQVERFMRTIMNLLRVETTTNTEWSKGLWKIQLVLNTTIHKTTKETPLKTLIGRESSTPLIQKVLEDLATDMQPIRNLNIDRQRVKSRLDEATNKPLQANKLRRNTLSFEKGDFVLMHRDEQMHKSKLKYEFQGPYEVVGITPEGRYELRRVGKQLITKAAKEQLRKWPTDWSLAMDMSQLLEDLENETE